MSSKILGPEGESDLQPLVWRRVGEATVSSGPPRAPLPENAASALHDAPILKARIAELEQQIPRLVEQARQAGIKEGEAAAGETATRQVEAIAERGAHAIEELIAERRKMRRRLEEDLVHLAVAVARRVLHRELSVDPEALGGIVRAVLDRMDAREVHRLRVRPADAPFVEKHIGEWQTPVQLRLEKDPSLERGAIVFDTARGSVDASVETQLREIDRGFTDLVRRQNS
ncbi:MAG: FliH/SctL family protein [Acidobacteriota bacterium]